MMKLKKGDMVKIITGTSRGKTGKVLQVFSEKGRITVEGVNVRVKHTRPRKEGQKGQKIEFPAPMAVSNVMLLCPKCQKQTRIAMQTKVGDLPAGKAGKKLRMCKQCKQVID
ncbi:MAG: 50S ribosomal protein L24 [bacterium]|nr:50S ribosomal protein L24 [bacterium]